MNISNKKQIQLKEIIIHVENMHVDKDFFVNSQKNIFLYDIVRWKISDPNIIKTKQS